MVWVRLLTAAAGVKVVRPVVNVALVARSIVKLVGLVLVTHVSVAV